MLLGNMCHLAEELANLVCSARRNGTLTKDGLHRLFRGRKAPCGGTVPCMAIGINAGFAWILVRTVAGIVASQGNAGLQLAG